MEGIEAPNELDDYLSQPVEKVRDPITWWWEHRVLYPRPSVMALDYLSIPGAYLTLSISSLTDNGHCRIM